MRRRVVAGSLNGLVASRPVSTVCAVVSRVMRLFTCSLGILRFLVLVVSAFLGETRRKSPASNRHSPKMACALWAECSRMDGGGKGGNGGVYFLSKPPPGGCFQRGRNITAAFPGLRRCCRNVTEAPRWRFFVVCNVTMAFHPLRHRLRKASAPPPILPDSLRNMTAAPPSLRDCCRNVTADPPGLPDCRRNGTPPIPSLPGLRGHMTVSCPDLPAGECSRSR